MIQRLVIAFLVTAALGGLGTASAAAAPPQDGRYEGATTNGVPVVFEVTDRGTQVEKWFADVTPAPIPGTHPDGSPCTTDKSGDYFDFEPIVNAHFNYPLRPNGPNSEDEGEPNVSGTFAGTFTQPGKAHGTYQVLERNIAPGDCTSVVMSWTAKLTEPEDNGLCEKAKARLKKAKKRLHRADTPAAKAKAKKKVKKARNRVHDLC